MSCISISQSERSFNQATYRNGSALARKINEYDHPLIIANAKFANNFIGLIGLSYKLKPDTQFQLIDETFQQLTSESSKSIFVYGGDSNALLNALLNERKGQYEPKLIFDDLNNKCCSETLWYLQPKQ